MTKWQAKHPTATMEPRATRRKLQGRLQQNDFGGKTLVSKQKSCLEPTPLKGRLQQTHKTFGDWERPMREMQIEIQRHKMGVHRRNAIDEWRNKISTKFGLGEIDFSWRQIEGEHKTKEGEVDLITENTKRKKKNANGFERENTERNSLKSVLYEDELRENTKQKKENSIWWGRTMNERRRNQFWMKTNWGEELTRVEDRNGRGVSPNWGEGWNRVKETQVFLILGPNRG